MTIISTRIRVAPDGTISGRAPAGEHEAEVVFRAHAGRRAPLADALEADIPAGMGGFLAVRVRVACVEITLEPELSNIKSSGLEYLVASSVQSYKLSALSGQPWPDRTHRFAHDFVPHMQPWGCLMTDDQVPFDAELISNPEPRCPCVLLLDTSVSMRGRPLQELNEGVQTFRNEILADKLATQRVEVAMITFGPVNKVSDFQTFDHFNPPHLQPTGDTPMGAAIVSGLNLLEERKRHFKAAGVSYYRPWLFLITDGGPTDNYQEAASRVHAGDNDERKAFSFWGIGVEGADMTRLGEICSPNRPPLKLGGLNFRELFVWLSASMKSVAQSRPGEAVSLPQPKWLTV